MGGVPKINQKCKFKTSIMPPPITIADGMIIKGAKNEQNEKKPNRRQVQQFIESFTSDTCKREVGKINKAVIPKHYVQSKSSVIESNN